MRMQKCEDVNFNESLKNIKNNLLLANEQIAKLFRGS